MQLDASDVSWFHGMQLLFEVRLMKPLTRVSCVLHVKGHPLFSDLN